MTTFAGRRISSYMAYLPAVYQEADDAAGGFLGRFLLAFEQILSGLGVDAPVGAPTGLAELLGGITAAGGRARLAGIERFFTPGPARTEPDDALRAPAEFLGWLASWVALSLRADWDEEERRRILTQVVQLYRLRGTRAGLIAMLRAYSGDQPVEVYEFDDIPHYFQVNIWLQTEASDPQLIARRQLIVQSIIDLEKPAHTFYALRFADIPTLRVGVAQVGVSTLLGAIPANPPPLPPEGARP